LVLAVLLFRTQLDPIQVHGLPEMIQYFHQLLQQVEAGGPEVMLLVEQAVRVAAGTEVMLVREEQEILHLLAHRKEIQEETERYQARIMAEVAVVVPVVLGQLVAVLVVGMVETELHHQ